MIGPTRPRLVLDVGRLQFCDSVGLSALIGAQRRADLAGGRMILHGVHGMLERILRMTGAGVLFTIVAGGAPDCADQAEDAERAGELRLTLVSGPPGPQHGGDEVVGGDVDVLPRASRR